MRTVVNRNWISRLVLLMVVLGLWSGATGQTRPSTQPATGRGPSMRPSAKAAIKPVVKPATTLPAALLKANLETMEDLKALEKQIKVVVEKVSPAIVGLRVAGFGSGVIISEDGYVLTAGHVSAVPNRPVEVTLPNGKRVKGVSLGLNQLIDSGLVKITEPGPLPGGKWPFAELGKSSDLKPGSWAIAMGHPGGFRPSRTPPVRLGRVLNLFTGASAFIRTDCTLVGGDSGGPLFDLNGRVIGIHSRIGGGLSDNMHVPVDTYLDTWDRLAAGETWGRDLFLGLGKPGSPWLGVQVDRLNTECRIDAVFSESPAAKFGLRAGDVVLVFDGRPVRNYHDLSATIARHRVGDKVMVEVRRTGSNMNIEVTLGRVPEQ